MLVKVKHVLYICKNMAARWSVLLIRGYLRHCPIEKGKGRLFDVGRRIVKGSPEAFRKLVIRTDKGLRWRIDTASLCLRHLLLQGRYSPDESRLLESILTQGDVFVDIGAHAGYFSILASSLVGEKGAVLAFEPAPAMQELFRENVALNEQSNILLFPYAASDKSGEAVFFVSMTHAGSSSLRSPDTNATVEIKVRTVLVDQCLGPDVKERVKLVKVDVEGAELLALEGMRDLLSRDNGPDVMCEVTDRFLQNFGGSEHLLLRWMRERGYHAFRIEGSELEPIQQPLGIVQYNALFTKRKQCFSGNQ